MQDALASDPAHTSRAIVLIRPLLILFMMLAHLGALNNAVVMREALPLTFDNWFAVFLKSALAKSGVPLLSLISGYLAVYSLHKYGYLRILWRKAGRLVWPLVWANLLFIILIIYPAQAADPSYRSDLEIYPFDPMGWFRATFAFYRLPANQPLFFLKDLYTCFLLIPLLVAVARIRYLNVLVAVWMAWKCIYLQTAFLVPVYPVWFLRFDIVFAFYVGIMLYLNTGSLVIESRRLNLALAITFPLACGLAAAGYVVLAKEEHTTLFLWLDFIVKLISVVGCIGLMSLLVARDTVISRALARLSPYAYTLFLTHAFFFTWFDMAWQRYLGHPDFFGPGGLAYLLLIYLTAVVAAVLLRLAWTGFAGWTGLSGARATK